MQAIQERLHASVFPELIKSGSHSPTEIHVFTFKGTYLDALLETNVPCFRFVQ